MPAVSGITRKKTRCGTHLKTKKVRGATGSYLTYACRSISGTQLYGVGWTFVAVMPGLISEQACTGRIVCVERYRSVSWYKLGINGSETA